MFRRHFSILVRSLIFNKILTKNIRLISNPKQALLFNETFLQPHLLVLGTKRNFVTDSKVEANISKETKESKGGSESSAEINSSVEVETKSFSSTDERDISSNATTDTSPNESGGNSSNYGDSSQIEKNTPAHIVFMRGLPYSATKDDVIQFFSSLNIKPKNVVINLDQYGFTNGRAEVEFETQDIAVTALKKQNHYIGNRYIELALDPFPPANSGRYINRSEPRSGLYDSSVGFTIKLSGLPYNATSEDVRKFFEVLDIHPLEINLKHTADGYPLGICFVKFQTMNEATEALKNNNKYIGNRYIKISLMRSIHGRTKHPSMMYDDEQNSPSGFEGISSRER